MLGLTLNIVLGVRKQKISGRKYSKTSHYSSKGKRRTTPNDTRLYEVCPEHELINIFTSPNDD